MISENPHRAQLTVKGRSDQMARRVDLVERKRGK
jgi:hypothetical protein